ncbi:MAG: ATP-binding protein [Proteobacteria bacterium]|nr:ATP-binding protein [Pseudomonadota bacterium]
MERIARLSVVVQLASVLLIAVLLIGGALLVLSRQVDQLSREVALSRHQQEAVSLARVLAGDARFLNSVALPGDRYQYVAEAVSVPVALDGRDDDWSAAAPRQLSIDHLLEIFFPYSRETLTAEFRIGTDQDSVYLIFKVVDDVVVYRDLNSLSVHRNDHIQLAGIDGSGRFRKFTLAAFQPAEIVAWEVSPETGRALREVQEIRGRWLATERGYNVELRLPRTLVTQGFSSVIVDVDDASAREIRFVMGLSHVRDSAALGELLASPTPLEQLMDLLDGQIRIEGSAGQYLAGYKNAGADENLLEVSVPIVRESGRLGTLHLKSDYQPPSPGRYFMVPAGILAGCLSVLLLWVLQVSRRQSQQTRAALARADRVTHYNEYLERMASRLNHELRTPVTIIKSSLERLETSSDEPERSKYVERALQGVSRLNGILNKMAEARRLEEALDEDEVQSFNLAELVRGCVDGYRTAYGHQEILLGLEADDVPVTGIPELLAQLFDKLIENAVSFSTGDPVRVRLNVENDRVFLRVLNAGPPLEVEDPDLLFESMVRLRPDDTGDHLGLGLYIARTIARFHGGELSIANREDCPGVTATLELPLLRITAKLK